MVSLEPDGWQISMHALIYACFITRAYLVPIPDVVFDIDVLLHDLEDVFPRGSDDDQDAAIDAGWLGCCYRLVQGHSWRWSAGMKPRPRQARTSQNIVAGFNIRLESFNMLSMEVSG